MNIEPRALYQFTGHQLLQLAEHLMQEIKKEDPSAASKPLEMCTRQVQQHLIEKGYRCISKPGLRQLLDHLKLSVTRKGKENWYKTSQIEAIPPRKMK